MTKGTPPDVGMGVVETRHDEPTIEVDRLHGRVLIEQGRGTDSRDSTVGQDDGLCQREVLIDDRDGSSRKDQVGRDTVVIGCARTQGECEEEDSRPSGRS